MCTTCRRRRAAQGFLLEVSETHRVDDDDDHHHQRPPPGDGAALLVHSPLAEL